MYTYTYIYIYIVIFMCICIYIYYDLLLDLREARRTLGAPTVHPSLTACFDNSPGARSVGLFVCLLCSCYWLNVFVCVFVVLFVYYFCARSAGYSRLLVTSSSWLRTNGVNTT